MNATKKRKAVEDQIRCHKLYLQTIAETNSPLFKFSSKKVAKDVPTLIRNLTSLMIIAQAREEDMDNSDDNED
uniref:Uncharacterized protein n=1 Tax=Panagrolaimus sp. PS1159 TaxID=55785 RepID=A0AC35FY95_9BILA